MYSLSIASLYHDIGKIKIPDMILNKAGRLTDSEMEMMKTHSKWSSKLLSDLKYDVNVIVPVLLHHENYDGTGYPYHLKGYSIPIEARIIRVADVYDALISKRPYKDPFSSEKALEIMQQEARFWDKQVFQVLLNVI